MAVSFKMVEGRMRAYRGTANYSIDLLSDGERAALLLAGAILVRPPNSFIAIDEPELHLHPSISGPLISAAIRSRPDVGFLISSHDLQLIEWLSPSCIIHVRDSVVVRLTPETRQFDVHIMNAGDGVREELKTDLLGSRRSLLMVEGEVTSEDRSLYSLIYPGFNVVPRGGADRVISDVKSLRENSDYHWLHVYGLIDKDGRPPDEERTLAASGIFSLPCPQIENLFCNRIALNEMAVAISTLMGGQSAEERLFTMEKAVMSAASASREDIICRKLVWSANRHIQESKVSVKSIRNGQTFIESIDLTLMKAAAEQDINNLLSSGDAYTLLPEIPIKNSSIPQSLATSLGFSNFKAFQASFLQQIGSESPAGRTIIAELRRMLPTFAAPAR
jgi:energy-coupling factor transporter ATP-binding protein EcfA2